jgi:hypothetical protein
MQKRYSILFYEDGNPIDHRCITRFLHSFPGSYATVVTEIIRDSESLCEDSFKHNVARLLPAFMMTRAGAFRGVRIDEKKGPLDPNGIIEKCWKKMEVGLREIKGIIKSNVKNRSRTLVELQSSTRNDVFERTSRLFIELLGVRVGNNWVRRVGASKILFAALPEIALPVDNTEWDHVFRTKDYAEILSTMTNEIVEWEDRSRNFHLDDAVRNLNEYKPTTLPAIYNVLAMAARPLQKHE